MRRMLVFVALRLPIPPLLMVRLKRKWLHGERHGGGEKFHNLRDSSVSDSSLKPGAIKSPLERRLYEVWFLVSNGTDDGVVRRSTKNVPSGC